MKLTFDQNDIVAALRAHIAAQGISLEGKTVDIQFTMKKGNAGVAAHVSIEAVVAVPDLNEPVKPTLSVVINTTSADADKVAATETGEPAPEAQATGTDDAAGINTAAVKTTSLFS